ncbi:MAG TPA: hypothetical protein VD769_09505 [Gaiellaceae bacterium]|nr:hypothetical protein [Gaiellaceae bacterium]
MSTFMKIMLVPALVVALSVGVALAASGGGDDASPLAQVAPTTSTVEDVTTTLGTTTPEAEDVSGPCDEAEHANDPRCTGAAPADDDRGDRGDGDGRDDDNSGPGSQSSGPGHDGDDDDDHDDDRGGHRGGDDDRHDDDSGGHGRGGDDR